MILIEFMILVMINLFVWFDICLAGSHEFANGILIRATKKL